VHALAAAALRGEVLVGDDLPIALRGDHEQRRVLLHHVDAYHRVTSAKPHSDDARGVAPHGAHLLEVRAEQEAVLRSDDHVVVALHELHVHQLVVLFQVDGDDPALLRVDELAHLYLLKNAVARAHAHVDVLPDLRYRAHGGDVLPLREVDDAFQRLSPAGLRRLRQLVGLESEDLALVREEEYVVVGGGDVHHVDEVLLLAGDAAHSLAAAPLFLERVDRKPPDETVVGDGHHHLLVRDQVLHVEVGGRLAAVLDLRFPRSAVFLLYLAELVLDDGEHLRVAFQDRLQFLDPLHQLLELVYHLLHFQAGQLLEAHVQYRLRLYLRKLEALNEPRFRVVHGLGGADDLDHLVDVLQGDLQPLQDVGALLRFFQLVLRAPRHHGLAVHDVVGEDSLEVQDLRLVVHQREEDDTE